VTFTFIGGVWIAHNYMTRFVKATDRGLLQPSAAVVGLLLPVIAVIFYLAVSMIYLIEPFREVDIHAPRAAPPGKP
jgi:hypothetical protein